MLFKYLNKWKGGVIPKGYIDAYKYLPDEKTYIHVLYDSYYNMETYGANCKYIGDGWIDVIVGTQACNFHAWRPLSDEEIIEYKKLEDDFKRPNPKPVVLTKEEAEKMAKEHVYA